MRLFIAANFYNNERILPLFIDHIQHIITKFGAHNIYISIYENGSRDGTRKLLQEFKDWLHVHQVPHRIVMDTTLEPGYPSGGRIPYLSKVRNKAMEPFYFQFDDHQQTYHRLVFFNDIEWTLEEFRALLLTQNGDYDAVCGIDYYWLYYDTYATREMPPRLYNWIQQSPNATEREIRVEETPGEEFEWMSPLIEPARFPYFRQSVHQRLMESGQPVPVYSCWNGLAIFNTEPFYKHRLWFRALPSFPEKAYDASECCLIMSDLHRHGYHRVYIQPEVRVTYSSTTSSRWWADGIVPLLNRLWYPYFGKEIEQRVPADMIQAWQVAKNHSVDYFDRLCIQT